MPVREGYCEICGAEHEWIEQFVGHLQCCDFPVTITPSRFAGRVASQELLNNKQLVPYEPGVKKSKSEISEELIEKTLGETFQEYNS